MGKIITFANSKGGVGKTTASVHLAAWLHELGYKVILVDCDAQQSSSEWMHEAYPEMTAPQLETADEILDTVPAYTQQYDYVIADGPGSNNENTRALLMICDLAVFPCKASMLEVRALAKATKLLHQARTIRGGPPPAKIILNMTEPRYKLASEMEKAAAALRLPILSTIWRLRQIYSDVVGQGTVVWKLGSRGRRATEEVDQIFRELLPEAVTGSKHSVLKNKPARTTKPKKKGGKS